MEINAKVIKWIRIGIEAAFLLTFLFLCITVGVKNKTIKVLKQQVKTECMMADSLQARCDRLAKVDCITVETSCIINNKGLVNVSQTNQLAKTISTYTKGEVLSALDSLANLNNKE